MVPQILREYRRLFAAMNGLPRRALEVGALPNENCLLTVPELTGVPERIAINLTLTGEYDGVLVREGDARDLQFDDGYFDLVLCNAVLEHIPQFWRACEEMRRVLAPGGRLIVSTPGYERRKGDTRMHNWASKLHLPDLFQRYTITMRVHDAPADYYRFSEYAYREVILADLADVEVWSIMTVPRIFGSGIKPTG